MLRLGPRILSEDAPRRFKGRTSDVLIGQRQDRIRGRDASLVVGLIPPRRCGRDRAVRHHDGTARGRGGPHDVAERAGRFVVVLSGHTTFEQRPVERLEQPELQQVEEVTRTKLVEREPERADRAAVVVVPPLASPLDQLAGG